jgi:hypothetical protein
MFKTGLISFYARAESQEPHSDMLTYMALFSHQILGPIHKKEHPVSWAQEVYQNTQKVCLHVDQIMCARISR